MVYVLALIVMGSESPWVLAVLISCIAILWLTTTWSHYRLRSDGRAALHRGPSRLHRTKDQVGDINRVLDGDIDGLIKSYLMKKSSGTLGQATPDEDDD